ncbi:MAG: prepilin-type N-terminal cleavage/methylation domain-containing protein [Candidatus Pacebacteria bacterium]|nr:prepilin-type N-terminal cleavage/methylation domain-containing protein [Candidatus Paceibacterota bacterium]
MKSKSNKTNRGFTLIEILIVIGIIAVLAAIVIVAINPAKQFAQARNTQRSANVNAILNAIGQRMADNKGIFEGQFTISGESFTCGVLPNPEEEIADTMATNTTNETGNLGCLVPTYIPTMPKEPLGDAQDQYTVEKLSNGRIQVCAPEAIQETAIPSPETICVTR